MENSNPVVKITLKSDYQSSLLSILPSQLLYIESVHNYASVYFWEDEMITKHVIRSTLKKLEAILYPDYIQRCHRSYIVNLNQIKKIHGNSQGYSIELNGLETFIPVSRKYVDLIANLKKNQLNPPFSY